MRQHFLAAIAAVIGFGAASAADACGTADDLCQVPLGEYRVEMPDGDGPFPTLMFLHGFGGSANGAVNLVRSATDRGYVVIGPQGLLRNGDSGPSTWSFHPERAERRDESVFFEQVLADATDRFGVDPDRVLVAGFSLGGSMASYLGCETPDIARAFAPVAGAFWRPHPEMTACNGPMDVYYTHGWRDGTVPLEGRVLGGGAILQGDAFYALQIWRETNGCDRMWPDRFSSEGELWTRSWTSCSAGSLEFVLHPGGHAVPRGWTDRALDWFEAL